MTFKALVAILTLFLGVAAVYFWLNLSLNVEDVLQNEAPLAKSTQPVEAQKDFRGVKRMTNPAGWSLPDIKRMKPLVREKSSWWQNVYVTDYDTGEQVIAKYRTDESVRDKDKIVIWRLGVFEVGGREFCYLMLYREIATTGRTDAVKSGYYTFYDLDGNGSFETLDSSDDAPGPLTLPDWVKQ